MHDEHKRVQRPAAESDRDGDAPAVATASGLAGLALETQRTAGNAAAQQLIQRWGWGWGWAASKPKIVKINGEEVEVADDAEKKEATAIIKQLSSEYGISVSSLAGVKAIKKDYTRAPAAVKKKLKTIAWKMKELRAVSRALKHYAPILGARRRSSTRADVAQEATSVSKVDQAIDVDAPTGVLDTTTLGEFFTDSKNFSMFTAGTDNSTVFGDNDTELEATATHELGHGLMEYTLPDYVAALDFWTDQFTASGKAGAEAPITAYGATNAAEDLCEALMFYFIEPEKLLKGRGQAKGTPGNPCPTRYWLIDKFVRGWQPIRDLPAVNPDVAYA